MTNKLSQPKRNIKSNAVPSSNANHDTEDCDDEKDVDHQLNESPDDLSPSTWDVLFYTLFLPMVLILVMGKSWMPQEQPYVNYYSAFDDNSAAGGGGGDVSLETDVGSSEFMAPSPVSSNKEDLPKSYEQGSMSGKKKEVIESVEESGGDDGDEKGDDMVPSSNARTASENAIGKDRNGTKVNSRAFYNSYVKRPQSSMKVLTIGDERGDNVSKKIDSLRQRVDNNSRDVQALVELANNLRNRDMILGLSGNDDDEVFWCYEKALQIMNSFLTKSLSMNDAANHKHLQDMTCMIMSYYAVSFASSDMYDDAIAMYDEALDNFSCSVANESFILHRRAEAHLVSGNFYKAGKDIERLYKFNRDFFLSMAMSSFARLLHGNADGFPGGWESILEIINYELSLAEQMIPKLNSNSSRQHIEVFARRLQKLHYALFFYNEQHLNDTDKAWYHLEESQKFKAIYTKTIPDVETSNFETNSLTFTPNLMNALDGVGSETRVPIFIVGFPRSGTTLLERILDSHPQIVGLGEHSPLHARLNHMKIEWHQAFSEKNPMKYLEETIAKHGDEIKTEMIERWNKIIRARLRAGDDIPEEKLQPLRIVDKVNTNHRNLGYIHLLFPNALIIHCARNPMDSVFSSYKHDFNVMSQRDGEDVNIDNTSTFSSVSSIYRTFRRQMDYWDAVLPAGRVFKVRYEEMVDDLEGVARTIIEATGLKWDESVLDFYKKKQHINTFSSTQVRKKIYSSSINSWKKYEPHLQPLLKMLDTYKTYDLTTSNYKKN